MPIEILRRRPVSELMPSKAATRLISHFEGLSLKAYKDAVGVLTIGYGHTGPDVVEGQTITLKRADELLEEDTQKAWNIVRTSVQAPLTQGEADALTSLAYNLGKVPKSMLACLNGGTTDKGEVMSSGSYGSAMKQFPRNCRAGGVPLKGLYRRRLAEACVFSDLPFENACSQNLVSLQVDASGNIDPLNTTSLEDTLQRARQDVPILRPDPTPVLTKPWAEIAMPKPQDELVLNKPVPQPKTEPGASPPALPAEGVSASPPSPPPQVSIQPKPAPIPTPAPVAPPPPPKPVIIASQTVNPNSLPTSETTKNMADSTRVTGMILVGIGTVVQVLTVRLGVGTAVGAIFFDLTRDPVVITLMVTAIVGSLGWLTKKNGEKTFKKGAENAHQALH